MPLWRVDIANVSFRYVDAKSNAQAIEAVRVDLVRALSIAARRASPEVQHAYDQAGPNQRRAFLRALDGLHGPPATPASLKEQIARLQYELDRTERWIGGAVGDSPPVDSARAERLAAIAEHNRTSIEHRRVDRATQLANRLARDAEHIQTEPE